MNVDIKPLVENTPNDMELGAKIRKIYWDRIDKINQLDKWDGTIYESPDGGKTVFRRDFGDYNPKNKIEIDWDTGEPTGRDFTQYREQYIREMEACSTQNPKSMKYASVFQKKESDER